MSPTTLAPIPEGVPIVDRLGAITDFFRLRWQSLIDGFQLAGVVAAVQLLGQTAAIVPTSAYLTKAAGLYRVSYYARKTVADGVASSFTFTWGWTESALPLTEPATALVLDTTGAEQSGSKLVWADALTDLTYQVAYASTTPAKMTYRINVTVEHLSA